MTFFGGRSFNNIQGAVVVVEHSSLVATKWLLKQAREGIREAHGDECPLAIFVLSDDIGIAPMLGVEADQVLPRNPGLWIPEVFTSLRRADVIVVSGVRANAEFSKKLIAPLTYHAILADTLDQDPDFLPGHQSNLDSIAGKASAVFFSSEQARSNAEKISPALCERTRVFGPAHQNRVVDRSSHERSFDLLESTAALTPNLKKFYSGLYENYREETNVPATILVGEEGEQTDFVAGKFGDIRFLPGIHFSSRANLGDHANNAIKIIDDIGTREYLIQWKIEEARELGTVPVKLSRITPETITEILRHGFTPSTHTTIAIHNSRDEALSVKLRRALTGTQVLPEGKRKILLSGVDFKFAASLVRELQAASDIEFIVQRLKNHNAVDPEYSRQVSGWAEVVLCEFLTETSVWYSNNLGPSKKLIIHMHGFELYTPLVERINIVNVHAIVVPSYEYRSQVLQKMSWPASKIVVIPNSGSKDDLRRPKFPDSRFTLGFVGWVPSLKRADRALDLLDNLLDADERYHLEIRGASPWNYQWEWQIPSHRDSYLAIIERLRTDVRLADHVTIAPFGPDIGNWLRGIGWMLSPSARESFHLAPVEGMLSGSVPLVWDRSGAQDIYGADFVFADTADVAAFVTGHNESDSDWRKMSERAYGFADERYSETKIRKMWHEILIDEGNKKSELPQLSAAQTQQTPPSIKFANEHNYLGAWDALLNGNEGAEFTGVSAKMHEAWVRGHVRLPSQLLASEQTGSLNKTVVRSQQNTILVQVAEFSRQTPVSTSASVGGVLLAPPAGSAESENFKESFYSRFEPLTPLVNPKGRAPVPLDEYLSMASDRLYEYAQSANVRHFRVEAPYWGVIAAINAAKKLGGSVEWDLTRYASADVEGFRPTTQWLSDNPIEAASRYITNNVSSVHVACLEEIPSVLLEVFSENQLSIPRAQHEVNASKVDSRKRASTLPSVSVVIPSYRNDNSIFESLDSLVEQSYPSWSMQIVVVCNGPALSNFDAIEEYAKKWGAREWVVDVSNTGASTARNKGLDEVTGDLVTFLDDDDVVQRNYISSLVASSQKNAVVVTPMLDRLSDGEIIYDTGYTKLVKALGYDTNRASSHPSLFASNGAKLIPRGLIGERRFDETLSSGEDIAFLGQIISNPEIKVVAAHNVKSRAYIRKRTDDSVSRRDEIDFQFAVIDRLTVAYTVWTAVRATDDSKAAYSIVTSLVGPQLRIMKEALGQNPRYQNHYVDFLSRFDSEFQEYVQRHL